MKKRFIIAGPCAAESAEQVSASVREAKKRNIDFMRMCLWKPRTKPGFDGLGDAGIDLLIQAARSGVSPATEVLTPEQASAIINPLFQAVPDANLLLWIGSRNQNHHIQREIAKVVAANERVTLMIKNQPWASESHWEGIVLHALDGGVKKEQVVLCHRGFSPNGSNPYGYRNLPDFEMARRMREKTGLPMIFDPSHIGGTAENVSRVFEHARSEDFDGLIVEVHPDPKTALTDADQQLTWEEFDRLRRLFYGS